MPTAQTVAGVTVSRDESPLLRSGNVSKSRGGLIFQIIVQNTGTLAYFQLFKNLVPSATPPYACTLPADASVPDMTYQVAANSTLILNFPGGDGCPTSIAWCQSSTQATKTIGTAAFIVHIDYR